MPRCEFSHAAIGHTPCSQAEGGGCLLLDTPAAVPPGPCAPSVYPHGLSLAIRSPSLCPVPLSRPPGQAESLRLRAELAPAPLVRTRTSIHQGQRAEADGLPLVPGNAFTRGGGIAGIVPLTPSG